MDHDPWTVDPLPESSEQREARFREGEARYRAFIANTSEGIWRYEGEQPVSTSLPPEEQIKQMFRFGFLAECNDANARMYGFERAEEMVGRRLADLAGADPRNLDHLRAFIRAGYRLANAESFGLDRYGNVRYFDNSFIGVVERGYLFRVWGVQRDITERKRAEADRQVLQAQLVQAQKMEAIGQLAGGIAHDFNNLLTVIQGHCGLLLESASAADASLMESAREIQAATVRAADLTRQLLTFSRRQPMQTRPLDLDDAVLSVGRMLQRLIGENIILHTRLLPGGAWVEGDSGMIEQVVINLAVNARDAMPDGGELWLELDNVTLDDIAVRGQPAARPGSFICLSLRDTGRGIAEGHLPHIFEPFFTTKEVGKGTGLGLATVHGIVEQHHGWIEVESHLGEGTTFRVYLPRLPEGAALPGGPRDASRVPGGNESILVVEDEPAVRSLAVKILGAQGYRVLGASSGAAALELWRLQPGAFDLLLTDLMMPGGVSGAQLAAQLKTEQPGLRVIYMSGYRGDTAGGMANVNFLQKPFDPAHLARAVRACLDNHPREKE